MAGDSPYGSIVPGVGGFELGNGFGLGQFFGFVPSNSSGSRAGTGGARANSAQPEVEILPLDPEDGIRSFEDLREDRVRRGWEVVQIDDRSDTRGVQQAPGSQGAAVTLLVQVYQKTTNELIEARLSTRGGRSTRSLYQLIFEAIRNYNTPR